MSKILIVAYGGGHIASCLPVAESLKSCGYEVDLLALTTAHEYARLRGWQPMGFKDFLDSSDMDALLLGDKLMAQNAVSELISKEESQAYLGMNYRDLITAFGEQAAASTYAERGRQAFLPVRTFERIFKRLKPDVLLTTCAPRSEYAALLAAYNLEVPSVCILDLPEIHMVSRVASAPGVRAICVGNTISKKMLLQRGVNSSIVHVTGNPAFDELSNVSEEHVDEYRNVLKVESNTKVLLWASQPEPAIHPVNRRCSDPQLPSRIENELRRWVSNRNDIRLVIRYHPSEERSFIPQHNVYLSGRNDDLGILLNACNAVVTMTSTVALQAASLGRTVLTIDLSVFTDDLPLASLGFSKGVNSMNMIAKALDEWAANPMQNYSVVLPTVGASERVCKVISGLLPI